MPSAGLAAVLLCLPAAAQTQILVATGDRYPGLGEVVDVIDVTVNDQGDWAATARFAGMPANWNALLVNGQVLLQPNDAVPGLLGSTTHFIGAYFPRIDAAGRVYWRGLSGLYRDLEPLALLNGPVNAPSLPPDATYQEVNNFEPLAQGGAVVVARLSNKRTLLRIEEQPGGGFGATSIAQLGDPWGPAGEPLNFIDLNAHRLGVDGQGRPLFSALFASGTGLFLGHDPIADTKGPTPFFGKSYADFFSFAANSGGDVAFLSRLSPSLPGVSDDVLIWNGQAVARRGEVLPGIAPHALTAFTIVPQRYPPVRLAANGRVLWWARWDDPDPERGEGLFLDQQPVVRKGETGILGHLIAGLSSPDLPDAPPNSRPVFDLSPDGEQLALRALLSDGRIAALRYDLGHPVELIAPCASAELWLCVPFNNQLAVDPSLCVGEGSAVPLEIYPGGGLPLLVRGQQSGSPVWSAGALAQIYFSTGSAGPCGIVLPDIGELLLDLTPPNPIGSVSPFILPALTWSTFPVVVPIPAASTLTGFDLYAQGVVLDLPGSGFPPVRLTNALRFALGLTP